MSSTIDKFPVEPIIVQTMSPDYRVRLEMPQAYQSLRELLDRQTAPIFLVVNISSVLEISVEDLLIGTELAAKKLYTATQTSAKYCMFLQKR